MTDHIKKSHNKSLLLYHVVAPVKYRRDVFSDKHTETLKNICLGIALRYEIHFIEIGADEDHVHFLIQTVPTFSPQRIVQTIKSITAREMFKTHPDVKQKLWGGEFWTKGYYINTVGQFGNATIISNYVKNQGRSYQQIYHGQPTLFEGVAWPPIPRQLAAR